jgi:hypothetical protein
VFTALAASGLCTIHCSDSLLFICWSILAAGTKIFFHWGPNLLLAAMTAVPLMGGGGGGGDDDDDDLQTYKNDSGTL